MLESPQIITLTLGSLDTNCYLLSCAKTLATLIIDPAEDGEGIADEILSKRLKPEAILLTHGHFDHVLGCLSLQLAFDIPIFLHPKDTFLLEKAQASAEYWTKLPADPVPLANQALSDNQRIRFGMHSLQVLHTPGHTPGSCSFVIKPDRPSTKDEYNNSSDEILLFVGDVIFKEGFGRTDFKYSNSRTLHASITKLRTLASGARTYAGHGEAFSL